MQEVITSCDGHIVYRGGELVRAQTLPYALGGETVMLDLCEDCHEGDKELDLSQLRKLVKEYGYPPSQRQNHVLPSAQVKRRRSGPRGANKRVDVQCHFCEERFHSMQGLGQHEYKQHPFQRTLWNEQHPDYLKELDRRRDKNHRHRIELLENRGLTLEQAAAEEKMAGPAGLITTDAAEAMNQFMMGRPQGGWGTQQAQPQQQNPQPS